MKLYFRKLPLELKRPLDQLAVEKLHPYELAQSYVIPEEIETELGTKEYIQWNLVNTDLDKNDPLRLVSLFITYYTGNPDKVPHTPDVCYVGGGGTIEDRQNLKLTIPRSGAPDDQVPFRLLQIQVPGNWSGNDHRLVGYFFAVNGTYKCQRNEVRLLQNNIRDRYAYFSKIELFFPYAESADRDAVVSGMEAFLRVLVPVLLEDHLPVNSSAAWKALNRGQPVDIDKE